jgi:hypothetical protein
VGYKPRRTTYTLVFEDEEYEGLEVKVTSISLGAMVELRGLATLKDKIDRKEISGEEAISASLKMFRTFADALVSWNLEHEDGTPVPATLDGVQTQDLDFIMVVIGAWTSAVAAVPGPLGAPSSSGEPSLAASIPMEISSPSLAS